MDKIALNLIKQYIDKTAEAQTFNYKGADGKSAYELAVDNGFVGSEQQWLASLAQGGGGAPLNSPQFTGVPTAPTAAAGTSTSQLATTEFVTEEMQRTVISPLYYGAVGNGTTDDTTALFNTFNRSDAVIEGGNKKYKLTQITLVSQKNLLIRNFHFYHGISITLKNCENITFENCIWDEFQDNGTTANVHCVILSTIHTSSSELTEENQWRYDEVCRDIRFYNCQFIGTHFTENNPALYEGTSKPHYNTGACLRLQGVDGLYVTNCYFTQNRGNACIHQNSYAPLGNFEIRNNLFYLNCWAGLSFYRHTGMGSYPTRVIQGNRFIGHGLGYLPWEYLARFDQSKRGVGTAALLGGSFGNIKNETFHCWVDGNYFEDNNESSIEGTQWNPITNNVIIGNGALQTQESVNELKAKYHIPYELYVRENPSENPIYCNVNTEIQYYPEREARVIENNVIARMDHANSPILYRGHFHEPIIFRNNILLDSPNTKKSVMFLKSNFYGGITWENNIGLSPYFNQSNFLSGDYNLDALYDFYSCEFAKGINFEDVSTNERFMKVKTARINPEFSLLRENNVSSSTQGKPTLGYAVKPVQIALPSPVWDIRNQNGYADGYAFTGATDQVVDTGLSPGTTDTDWTIFVDTAAGSKGTLDNSFLVKLLSFASSDGSTISLQLGSRWKTQSWTHLWTNGQNGGNTSVYCLDSTSSSSQSFLSSGKSTCFVLRHEAGSNTINAFAYRKDTNIPDALSKLLRTSVPFTSGTAGNLYFGGAPNNSDTNSYFVGTINDAQVFDSALSDAQVSMLLVGTDISYHETPMTVYDIANDERYVAGTGLTMDGTFGIDTDIPLLENTDDFTVMATFKFDKLDGHSNFSFIPVFSAMSADLPNDTSRNHTDKGFDVGLTMQNGVDMNNTARGGFITFRRDYRYTNYYNIDSQNYGSYQNVTYSVIIIRRSGVIYLYDQNLRELTRLTGDYATSIVNGNLTIGAKMGYDNEYTDFFKGVISEFKVFDQAIDLSYVEVLHPSIYDNDVSEKGAITYYLDNKENMQTSARYAQVEINFDLGEFNSAEYAAQYPKAFAIRLDQADEDVVWVPCGSSKRVTFFKRLKSNAIYKPFKGWTMDIINPGIVPGMTVTVEGVKVILLTKQEVIPTTTDATDFKITWNKNLSALEAEEVSEGYVQYLPETANAGLNITAVSDDTDVATVAVNGQNVLVTAVAGGETLIHISIPYGTEYVFDCHVSSDIYSIDKTLSHCSISNDETTIANGSSYMTTIAAESGYELDSVTVMMGLTDITSTAYNSTTGVINIPLVTNNISITATANIVGHYYINKTLSHCSISNSDITIVIGFPYTATLIPEEGYEMDSVTVTMGTQNVTSAYYDSATGVINIPAVTDNLSIVATAVVAEIDEGDLPSGYTELDYIQTTGSAWLDIGVNSGDIDYAEYEVMPTQLYSRKAGRVLSCTNTWYPFLTGDNTNGAQSRIGFKNSNSATHDQDAVGSYLFSFNLNEKHTLKGFVDGDVYVDNVKLFTIPKGTATSSDPLQLFRATDRATSDYGYNFCGKLYWMKFYKNGEVYRNYVPCRNSSNVVGLYETVQGTFISSATSTVLTGGFES